MKPRQREQQKQSSRMYLRKHDHRDVIYQDMYHNAMWCNTEDIDDELVWVKYPKHALLAYSNDKLGWLDADRQFRYGIGGVFNTSYDRGIYRTDDLAVAMGINKVLITDDGIVWHDVSDQVIGVTPTNGLDIFRYGANGLIQIENHSAQGYYKVKGIEFTYDEDAEEWTVMNFAEVRTHDISALKAYYWGSASGGAIIEELTLIDNDTSPPTFKQEFVLFDEHGWTIQSTVNPAQHPTFGGGTRYLVSTARCGNISCNIGISQTSNTRWADSWRYKVRIASTLDNGETFNVFEPENVHDMGGDAYFSSHVRCCMFTRNAVIYAMYGTFYADATSEREQYEMQMYKSTNGVSWIKVDLPTWLDMPVIEGGGVDVDTEPNKDTLRIAINPEQTSNADLRLFDMLPMKNGYINLDELGNIQFCDGEASNEDFYLMLSGSGWNAFWNNEYLAENAKAFSWKTASVADVPDEVIPYDYVLG